MNIFERDTGNEVYKYLSLEDLQELSQTCKGVKVSVNKYINSVFFNLEYLSIYQLVKLSENKNFEQKIKNYFSSKNVGEKEFQELVKFVNKYYRYYENRNSYCLTKSLYFITLKVVRECIENNFNFILLLLVELILDSRFKNLKYENINLKRELKDIYEIIHKRKPP
jgi:hypothetical protein